MKLIHSSVNAWCCVWRVDQRHVFFRPFSKRAWFPQQPWLIAGARYACKRKSQERMLALTPWVTTSSRRPRSERGCWHRFRGWRLHQGGRDLTCAVWSPEGHLECFGSSDGEYVTVWPNMCSETLFLRCLIFKADQWPCDDIWCGTIVDCFLLRQHCAECFEQHALLSVQTFDVTFNVLFVYHRCSAINCWPQCHFRENHEKAKIGFNHRQKTT